MITQEAKRGLGVFAKTQELEQAIKQLKASGYPMEKVSIIGKDIKHNSSLGEAQTSHQIGNQDVNTTVGVGDTLTSTTWANLLIGLSGLAIPSLGAILAAGSVGVALVASIAGVTVGVTANENLVRSLKDLGIPEDRARMYSDHLQQSYYLIILDGTDTEIDCAEAILGQEGIQNWGVFNSLATPRVR
ncbi:general stress protein [Trichormus azollae]|jgi:hypothetical protein|uniref:General stress protein 17M-like domain-containing protein n=1 Tax=Nostoc azollae (strain 0708) TaxID=551115 RepID=D7DYN8_NOSA0|nr:general stress protein [Trichormus azollae]ADI62861.1 conserved hypothetical protein ['Nostoc azollae' 0708]